MHERGVKAWEDFKNGMDEGKSRMENLAGRASKSVLTKVVWTGRKVAPDA